MAREIQKAPTCQKWWQTSDLGIQEAEASLSLHGETLFQGQEERREESDFQWPETCVLGATAGCHGCPGIRQS